MDSSLDDDNLELSDIEATGAVLFPMFTRHHSSVSSCMTTFAVSLANYYQHHHVIFPMNERLRRVDNII